ncbi:hypothetical protein DPMN_099042 [Dreissena polymorpha]|uniref:Uncharacterized protein n=1 Tax=Dreissena polymorpha TaxID=45954 RepID=A0A9D4R680_DREPO|nr:hypothetical protein DPMN_099042 [Dreissena polymorpha]
MRAGWLAGWRAGGISLVMEWLDVSFEEEIVTTTQHDPKRTVDMVRSHYDAGGAPARDQASTGMNRGNTEMNQCCTGMNRRRPGTTGAPPVNIKMLNTSEMNRESPGRTNNDRRGTVNNRDCTGTAP